MRVLICDDHALFSESLAALFELEGFTTRCVGTPSEALTELSANGADVCVLDLGFDDGSDGLYALEDIVASPTAVVVLTGVDDDAVIARCRRSGAKGFVAKACATEQVVDAIRRATREDGEFFVETARARPSSRRADSFDNASLLLRSLTAREREVLLGLVHGESAMAMAARTGVSYATARSHIQRVLTKLGVHSRTEAIGFAVRLGIVPEK
jgi:DNA-binding NarL/FixJ family response regulator